MSGKGRYREGKVGEMTFGQRSGLKKKEKFFRTGGKWVGRGAYIRKGKWAGMTLGQRSR